MVAGNVMPFDTISIEVIEDSNANFIAVTVVRLSFWSGLLSAENRTKTKFELFNQIMCNNSFLVRFQAQCANHESNKVERYSKTNCAG